MAKQGSNGVKGLDVVIGSGCAGYMIRDRDLFADLSEEGLGEVGNADKSQTPIEGSGTAEIWVRDRQGKLQLIRLSGALYVPRYSHNLLSVKRLNDAGVTVKFGSEPALVAPDGERVSSVL